MFKRLSSLLIGAACLVSSAAQAQDRDVKFALDFISLGRHAPWYVALGKGFYKQGLNVSIRFYRYSKPCRGRKQCFDRQDCGGQLSKGAVLHF